ncbi:protein kinase, putative [Cordyceps militaris CM01]|uniref:Protein kinase, putative n=1 Tax=Cordyceps militaris (strain CM01) TaxID=983644 RepID=G3J2S4_CORMM|nr:protein kinase, putative [Cordyceps militaris CM01]EGX96408.1 protein kinase, putative [Cordyceps militaris CM01]
MDRSNLVKSLPDIVRDAKIEAEIYPNQTKNIFYISTRSVRKKRIEELWVRDRELGRGGYGIVHLERCKTDGRTKVRAVKQIRKAAVPGQEFDYLRELEAVMKFSHPKYQHCFVRSDGWYESHDCIFIVMEYLEHGDLQKHLKQPLQEREARLITSQVLEGLRFMHENGFTHRDLKPANIMVVNKGPRWFVKIADFGISKRRHESSMSLQTPQRGTVGFAAPEVFGVGNAKGSYTSVVDMWSLGAVVYTMFTRTTPFPTVGDVCRYARGEIGFPLEKLKQCRITQHCQQFIMSLMVPDARQRLSSSKADKHPWMTIESSLMGSNGSNMRRSYSFRGRERSKRENVIEKVLSKQKHR